MLSGLSHVSLLVEDYDEALQWYTEKLGLSPRDNAEFAPGMRWITVAVDGQKDLELVLYKPDPATESRYLPSIGKQPGFVFNTTDCRGDVEQLRSRGVQIVGEPEVQPWGVQAIFADLYGNQHVLVEPPAGQ